MRAAAARSGCRAAPLYFLRWVCACACPLLSDSFFFLRPRSTQKMPAAYVGKE